jgi:hypothetical protein
MLLIAFISFHAVLLTITFSAVAKKGLTAGLPDFLVQNTKTGKNVPNYHEL